MMAGSSMVAITRVRPAQCGQRTTSMSKARRISAAHVRVRPFSAPPVRLDPLSGPPVCYDPLLGPRRAGLGENPQFRKRSLVAQASTPSQICWQRFGSR